MVTIPANNQFSFFSGGIRNTKPAKDTCSDEVVVLIRGDRYKALCNQIQRLQDKDRDKLKAKLDYVTPAGIFSERKMKGLVTPSGLAPIDIDDINNPEEIKNLLKTDRYIHLAFVSPSGRGLKIFIKIPIDKEKYGQYVISFYHYLKTQYGFGKDQLDEATKDISRACYLSHDPNCYYNKDSTIFNTIIETQTTKHETQKTTDESRSGKEFGAIVKLIKKGLSHEQVFKEMMVYAKWSESNSSYREHTYKKALEIIEQKETDSEIGLMEELEYLFSRKKVPASKITYAIAEYLMEKHHFLSFEDTGEIYVYHEGCYVSNGDKLISKGVEIILDNHCTTYLVNEVLNRIRRRTFVERKLIDKKTPQNMVCLKNGILNLGTLEVIPHTSDYVFFNKINVNFDVNKTKPEKILKFLREVVSEKDTVLLQEFIGYLLLKNNKYQKAVMFIGEGCNGKSTLINLIKNFLGEDNCVSIPLQRLEEDKFAVASLYGKMVNLFADLPARSLSGTSMFKILTGGDSVSGEKKFQDSFNFVNYAKMLFSANQLPQTPDDTTAFFRRWIIIVFPNNFEQQKDEELLDRITTEEELSGLLSWALEGLSRLENHGFSSSESTEKIREDYIRKSNSVAAFVIDKLEISSSDCLVKKEIYATYTDYCRQSGYPMVSENAFHRELLKQVRIEDYRPASVEKNGKRPPCWLGIKYKSPEENVNISNNPDIVRDVKDYSYYLSKVDKNSYYSKVNNNNHSIYKIKENVDIGDNVRVSEEVGEGCNGLQSKQTDLNTGCSKQNNPDLPKPVVELDGNKVFLDGQLKGKISYGVYITERNPEHFMRKFGGFGISEVVLRKLKELGVSDVQIRYNGKRGLKLYTEGLDKYLRSDKKHIDTSGGFDDPQLFLSVRDFEESGEVGGAQVS